MPWLVVLGDGSWSYGRRRFASGIHEIEDAPENADLLSAAASPDSPRFVLVLNEKPELVTDDLTGPLELDDLRVGNTEGYRLVQRAEDVVEVEAENDDSIAAVYPCPWCPEKFPHQGPRARHIEYHHAAITAQIEAQIPPPPPEPEPALTDA